jgi:hypothetical protein
MPELANIYIASERDPIQTQEMSLVEFEDLYNSGK